ncbi:MAG: hypothetical protein J6C01_05250 [Lachnospiraceae bacterium]|nr:hypothetical protein [Lachnospiraceae bacterium]
MKKMTKEAQMQANGGLVWAHCHKCGINLSAATKNAVRKKMLKHIATKRHTGVAYWGYDKIEYCDNTYR